jgi:ferredoxin
VLFTAPLLIAAFAGIGSLMAVPLSRLDPEVQLAEQLRREALGLTDTTTDASDAFRTARREERELFATVLARQKRFGYLGIALGAWVGFVIAVKLVSLAVRRPRDEYHANKTGCVSCGRCFWYCPVEQVRLGIIDDVAEVVEAK